MLTRKLFLIFWVAIAIYGVTIPKSAGAYTQCSSGTTDPGTVFAISSSANCRIRSCFGDDTGGLTVHCHTAIGEKLLACGIWKAGPGGGDYTVNTAAPINLNALNEPTSCQAGYNDPETTIYAKCCTGITSTCVRRSGGNTDPFNAEALCNPGEILIGGGCAGGGGHDLVADRPNGTNTGYHCRWNDSSSYTAYAICCTP